MVDCKTVSSQIEKHFGEVYAIWHMSEKHFKKFYSAYMGESLTDSDIFEARLLIVNMLLGTLKTDCEVILDEYKRSYPEEEETKED